MSSTNNDSEDDDPRVHSSGLSSSSQPRRYELSKSELRKNNKPIMEKKRRARINQCLNELKTLILDALKKDPARHTKLEKADILEMTVRHLQSLHRSSNGSGNRPTGAVVAAAGPSVEPPSSSAALTAAVVQKFQTGYQECAGEVNRFVGRLDGVDVDIKKRLMCHLDSCVAKMRYAAGGAPLSHHVNDYLLHRNPDMATVSPSAAMAPGGRIPLLHTGVADPAAVLVRPSVPLPPPSVGHRHRASAFTAVCGSSPSDVDRPPYVYCDETADVSSTSSWAEDAAAAAVSAVCCKNPPLDFSMKKTAAACTADIGKRPLGDIPVNVPTPAAAASSATSLHKTANAMASVSGARGPPTPAHRPIAAAAEAARPCDDPGSDPNMWRPW